VEPHIFEGGWKYEILNGQHRYSAALKLVRSPKYRQYVEEFGVLEYLFCNSYLLLNDDDRLLLRQNQHAAMDDSHYTRCVNYIRWVTLLH
jgi:hypothetical protein